MEAAWAKARAQIESVSVELCRTFVGGVGAEEANFGGAEAQFFEGGYGVGVVQSGLEVEIEAILPRPAGNRAALDFEQIDFAAGENGESAVKRSGLMRELDHEGKFIGAAAVPGG